MRFVPIPGVFHPHSDSWMLADLVRRQPLPGGARVLDLCTGSGIVALAAAERRDRHVVAVDVSRRSVLAVRLNSRLNGVRVEPRRGDLLDAVPGERFDLIASNPPYVPGPDGPVRGAARAWEGGGDGRRFLDRICRDAPEHLNPGGAVMLVHSAACSEEATLSQLREAGLTAAVIARHRGAPGRLMRERGLVEPDSMEEMVFVRAVRER